MTLKEWETFFYYYWNFFPLYKKKKPFENESIKKYLKNFAKLSAIRFLFFF